MKKETQISKEFYDQTTVNPAGYRDKRGEWRPAKPISYAPVFVWPAQLKKFGSWLFDYLFKWNLFTAIPQEGLAWSGKTGWC
jgi:hypothetical protein